MRFPHRQADFFKHYLPNPGTPATDCFATFRLGRDGHHYGRSAPSSRFHPQLLAVTALTQSVSCLQQETSSKRGGRHAMRRVRAWLPETDLADRNAAFLRGAESQRIGKKSRLLNKYAAPHSTMSRFCANGHSWSIHSPSQRKPVRAAISPASPARYLCELSVQMVSPSASITRSPAAGISTRCRRVDRRCISMRRSSAFHRASCRKHDKSKSARNSRLIRDNRFKLKAAVTPAGSSYASN